MKYTIWTGDGQSHPEFTNYRDARRYMRKGWHRVYTSGWFRTDEGEAQCCYPTRRECNADRDGTHAPKIERTLRF